MVVKLESATLNPGFKLISVIETPPPVVEKRIRSTKKKPVDMGGVYEPVPLPDRPGVPKKITRVS